MPSQPTPKPKQGAAKRIIPCLDIKNGRVVKGIAFENLRDAGDPLELALRYNAQSADELVFLDITASHEGRALTLELAAKLARTLFIPFTIGGGINSVEDVHRIVSAGADKVSVNTAAVQNPNLISQSAQRFGSQCIVLAMDVKRQPWGWEVFTHGGRKPTGIDALVWGREAEKRGAGEILLTSMDCDGLKNGFDLGITAAMSEALQIPIIASGGGGSPEHFLSVFEEGQADAALAASIFHFGAWEVPSLKQWLIQRQVPLRPPRPPSPALLSMQ